jgi:hypothetical protein
MLSHNANIGLELKVDTVKELTNNSGVTIDGVVLKDSNVNAKDLTLSHNANIGLELKVNTINELTNNSGVTIDSVVIKDSNVNAKDLILSHNANIGLELKVNTVNELTNNSGVTIDGVVLKDTNISAKDLTLSHNANIGLELKVNTIRELTNNSGVTIDGVLLKDTNVNCGDLTCSGNVIIDKLLSIPESVQPSNSTENHVNLWFDKSDQILKSVNSNSSVIEYYPFIEPSKSILVYDDFMGGLNATGLNNMWLRTLSGGTALISLISGHGGLVNISVGNTNTHLAELSMNFNHFNTNKEITIKMYMLQVKIVNSTIRAGLSVGANDFIEFVHDPATSANWLTRTTAGGTTTSTTTTNVVDITNYRTYEIRISSVNVRFYIDNALVSTHTTNIPRTNMTFRIQKLSTGGGGGSKDIYLDYVWCKLNR